MPRGADPKREHEYQELKDEFKEEGRYPGREEEVAARIVNKQRAQHGETKEARHKEDEGRSSDRVLPIDNYDQLTIDQIVPELDKLSLRDLRAIKAYEEQHQQRKTLLPEIEKRMQEQ
jgi:hypothetical protein